MNRITTVLLTFALLLGLTLSANARGTNARISSIKHEFSKIEANCKNGFYYIRTKEDEDQGEMNNAELCLDRSGKVRRYTLSAGSDDSVHEASYYYDRRGRLFFSYLSLGRVPNIYREIRSYYNKYGKLIKRSLKTNTAEEIHYYYKIKHPMRHFRNF